MITICFTHFKTLTLANFAAALYSVRRQDMSHVSEIVVVDNDSAESREEIEEAVEAVGFSVPHRVVSHKHGDVAKAQAWSTNVTVREAHTPWVFYTRSDYLLDFSMVGKFAAIVDGKPSDWDGFVVSYGCHLHIPISTCEQMNWRDVGPRCFTGVEYDYTMIDSGVWMARRETYDRVGGFDEALSAWGHAQTEFQYRMFVAGVEFVQIPEVLFYHPQHSAPRDIDVGHQQLRDKGLDIRKLWERYPGPKFY